VIIRGRKCRERKKEGEKKEKKLSALVLLSEKGSAMRGLLI
jgi:hypothetical protein